MSDEMQTRVFRCRDCGCECAVIGNDPLPSRWRARVIRGGMQPNGRIAILGYWYQCPDCGWHCDKG